MHNRPLSERYSTALVTGGAGFVGSHLVDALLEDGLSVISVDDYSAGKEENHAHLAGNPRFRAVKADVSVAEQIAPHLEGVDIVFHEAVSKNTVCMRDPARDLDVNAHGTLNVLLAAKAAGVKKFVHASTGSVYGEAQYFPTDEKHPLDPASYYGVSKLGAEKYARLFSDLHDLDTTILRYYHVFGPRQDNSDVGGVVSIFGRRAITDKPLIIYGDGTQLRSFTSVHDVVRINKLAAMHEGTRGKAYNCASGVKVTIQELADAVLKYFGKEHLGIEYRDWKPGDVLKFDVDNSKLKSLGFEFDYTFEQGLGETLEWLKQHLMVRV
ncbi:MAG: NAD-dependent epimerase/dehydratase family protein [Rhizobiaceae bacterium]|uniref:NAD-dependent epimerase/dehydratase family protein n=1 Tax=Parvibaculum sp. TaxID=2024848 RepID=UPI001B22D2AA|nr:NAD-dependent epimerase/dehydratase family protein [Parvibaculum sp.]MBO6633372.1 NAD-dependent epimerase/dehydratase family protein [Parvibaculum sp.]MBO6725841.1 NAD-dependent epimerase/dehydratase family protein [Rhizobiaceae bacterium]